MCLSCVLVVTMDVYNLVMVVLVYGYTDGCFVAGYMGSVLK
jgi:hypothetical protein